jgi:hypothetical protein
MDLSYKLLDHNNRFLIEFQFLVSSETGFWFKFLFLVADQLKNSFEIFRMP